MVQRHLQIILSDVPLLESLDKTIEFKREEGAGPNPTPRCQVRFGLKGGPSKAAPQASEMLGHIASSSFSRAPESKGSCTTLFVVRIARGQSRDDSTKVLCCSDGLCEAVVVPIFESVDLLTKTFEKRRSSFPTSLANAWHGLEKICARWNCLAKWTDPIPEEWLSIDVADAAGCEN